MNNFRSLDEMINALSREKVLLKEMFAKRKSLSFRLDFAEELVEYRHDRIQHLIDFGVIRDNGNFLELENEYVVYFDNAVPDVGKIIKIKDVVLEGFDNNMKLAFDSNAVYVPLNLNVVKGDSITNYSSTFFFKCYTHTNLHGEFMGEFFVNERPTTMSLYRPRQAYVPAPQKHNRNALGKFLNAATSKIIRF